MEYELARTVAMPVAPAGSVRQVDRVARLGALCDGIATAAVLGALFLLPITIFPFAESLFTLPKAMVLQYLAVFAVAASALKLVVGRQIQLRRSPLDLPIAAYLGFVAISVLHASSRDAALFGPNERADGFITLLGAVALYFVAYNLPGGGSMLRWGMRAAILSAT